VLEQPVPDAVVVARQPIVDVDRSVVGYELLYRQRDPDAPQVSGEQMTAQVVLGALTIGVDQLVGDKVMFCNAERGVLTGATPVTLPPERTVIEVLESVRIDDEAVEGCRSLVERGFELALDDFVWRDGVERLLELASIVKIDLVATQRDQVLALMERCRVYDVRLLAEKVETEADVQWALAQGFELFQGYAIERPALVHAPVMGASTLARTQLALTLLTEDLDFEEIEDILRHEPGLVVQVLQLASVGSHHGMRRSVRTMREALVLLGTVRVRQWVALTLLGGHATRSVDGLATALIRARTCEVLAKFRGMSSPSFAFTAGVLSSLDLLLGLPADALETALGLDGELTATAFRHETEVGRMIEEVIVYEDHLRGTGGREPAADLDRAAAAAFVWSMPYLQALSAWEG